MAAALRRCWSSPPCLGLLPDLTRFVLEQPAEWTEILIRFSLIWMVFLGIPTAFRQGAMVSVDVLYRWSPPQVRRVLDWLVCHRRAGADCGDHLVGLGLRASAAAFKRMAGLEWFR